MKIKKLSLRNYKKFHQKWERDFCDEDGEPHDMILLTGKNGTGKSSILQAIAMLVGAAVKPHTFPSDLIYPGFKWDNIQNGAMPAEVEAVLQFSQKEVDATIRYSNELTKRFPDKVYTKPGNSREIRLWLDYAKNEVRASSSSAFFQTKGYQYALQLTKFEQNFDQLFQEVGSIYIYHEQRTATSINTRKLAGDNNGLEEVNTAIVDEKTVKEALFRWYFFHQQATRPDRPFRIREGQRDFFARLEEYYQRVFPGRSFKGFAPKMAPEQLLESEQDFWLFDGQYDYEFSEMSGGERAIFPLLIDFANRNINNSIIIIDEVDLHLHPPLQQAFVRALPFLGVNNQFILTSHSDDVASMFSESQIIRLT